MVLGTCQKLAGREGGGGDCKNVGQSDDAKRRKQGDGLMLKISFAK